MPSGDVLIVAGDLGDNLSLPFLQWLADSVLPGVQYPFGVLFWWLGGPSTLIPFVAIGLIFRGTVRKPSG